MAQKKTAARGRDLSGAATKRKAELLKTKLSVFAWTFDFCSGYERDRFTDQDSLEASVDRAARALDVPRGAVALLLNNMNYFGVVSFADIEELQRSGMWEATQQVINEWFGTDEREQGEAS